MSSAGALPAAYPVRWGRRPGDHMPISCCVARRMPWRQRFVWNDASAFAAITSSTGERGDWVRNSSGESGGSSCQSVEKCAISVVSL